MTTTTTTTKTQQEPPPSIFSLAAVQITVGQQLMQHFQFQAGLIMPLEGRTEGGQINSFNKG